ncbi:LysM peptidoglycan-binding domain-containing protein [archaeon]|nr:LysM peptidoglycan-binding domain-containing protein [archaeon]
MKNKLLSLLAIPVVAATFLSCSPYRQIRIQPAPTGIERYVEKPLIQSTNREKPAEEFRRAPQYTRYEGYGANCTGYSVLAAIDAFNKKDMIYAEAWKLGDKNKVIAQVNGNKDLRELADKTLEPGMIVGFYNPHSDYNEKAKKEGAGYTHTATFVGKRNDGKLIFYHKYVDRMEKISLDDLGNEYDCSAREIIDGKTSKTKRTSKTNSYHTVKRGDTFWNIGERNNLSQQELKKLNPKIAPTKIYPKQRIRIR